MATTKSNGRGGKRPGSGRKRGTPNKATAEIKELARQYSEEAVKELARLATNAESESARVAAIRELLDRGYGRATQPIGGDPDNPLTVMVDASPRDKLAGRIAGVAAKLGASETSGRAD
jgi:hypothetical protein